MADEPDKPPTYEELLTEVVQLQDYALHLEEVNRGLQAGIAVRDAEIQRLTVKAGKKPARQLDPKAASAFDRPWNGR
jgi:hypothetical protein